jgi:hypothetical protein
LLGSATNDLYPPCRQDHCVFAVTNAAILTLALDWSPFMIFITACTLFWRHLHGLSAQPTARRIVQFSHHFWHALDRRVALIFWLFTLPSRLISERDTFSFAES